MGWSSSSSPTVTSISTSLESRHTITDTGFSISVSATMRGSLRMCVTFFFVERQDDVPRLDARFLGGAVLDDAGYQGAFRLFQPQAFGDFLGDHLDVDPKPAAAHAPVLDQLSDHRLGHRRGNRKSDADAAAVGEKIAVLMPMTSPFRLNIGPPELPRLMEASVCRKSS